LQAILLAYNDDFQGSSQSFPFLKLFEILTHDLGPSLSD